MPIIQAKDISLYELEEKFDLQLTTEVDFFSEWKDNLPLLTEIEKQSLKRVQSNYFNLSRRRLISEEAVKMVVLSPLLDLAGFYQSPFEIETETSVEIVAEEEGVKLRGNIDVLVVQKKIWILVIESKSTKFDVMIALPQALAYMLNSPNQKKSTFGLLMNGREFVFVKLVQEDKIKYARSYALSIEKYDEFEQVLKILKLIGELFINL